MSNSNNTTETGIGLYEIVLLFNPDLNDSSLAKEISKIKETIKSHTGEVKSEDSWGKRELSYLINKRSFAHYHLIIFEMSVDGIVALERQLKITTDVLRHLVVKKDKYAPDGRPSEEEEEDAEKAEGKEGSPKAPVPPAAIASKQSSADEAVAAS